MSRTNDFKHEHPNSEEPLALELASLREHFSPVSTSVFGGGVVPGIDVGLNGDALVDRRSPLQLDNAFVQQTKDQIRAIVETIASLAHAPISPDDFVAAVLPKISNAMGANGAAFWQQLPVEGWRLIAGFKLPMELTEDLSIDSKQEMSSFEKLDFLEAQLSSASEQPASVPSEEAKSTKQPSAAHLLLMNAVAKERQPILIPPGDALLSRDRPSNPCSELLIYAPLPIPKELGQFWLQVVQSPSGGPSSHRGYLRFVAQMADLMSDYFRSHRLRVFERDREYLAIAERTMNELAGGMNPKVGIAKLMKSLREHARSEHVFLLHKDSFFGGWRVVGAAGLVDIDRRATGIGQIERAASCLQSMFRDGGVLSGSKLSDRVDERDPDLTQLLNTFSVSELQWIKPLKSNASQTSHHSGRGATETAMGILRKRKLDVAVLITWSGIENPPARCFEQSGLIARLGLSALQVGWWNRAIMANRDLKSSIASLASPASWPGLAKWAIAILLLVLLCAVPVPIQLHATAVLLPLLQQHVYTPMDATVEEVLVKHGQWVRKGDLLIRMKSLSLSLDYEKAIGELQFKKQRLEDLKSQQLSDMLSPAQKDQCALEGKELQSVLPNDERRIALLLRQMELLSVNANVDGIISTWNVQENLRDRPLTKGQWLLSIHESDSPWIMEAALPERDAREFRQAIESRAGAPTAILTSAPQVQLPVHLSQQTPPRIENSLLANANAESRSATLRLRFEVDTTNLPVQSAMAGATARISIPIGRGPLIWALGKDFAYNVWSKVQLWI